MDTRGPPNLHSVSLLKHWDLWSALAPHTGAIGDIHVSHRGHFGSALMSAEELDVRHWVMWWRTTSWDGRCWAQNNWV